MRKATFRGGVHPEDGKAMSRKNPVKKLMPGAELVFPVSQHIGAPAAPIVKKGDAVLMGQKIAEAAGFVSANIYSSVSGTVKAVEPRMTVSGSRVNSIVIQNDGQYTPVEGIGKKRNYTTMSPDEIRNAVKDAGVVGLGGAGFPNHVKLMPRSPESIDFVIVNGAECEPYLTSDYRMLMEESTRLVEGLKVILSLFPNAVGVIAIEKNKPEAIEKLQAEVEKEPRVRVCPLEVKYPQGAERNLIYAVTGREINSKMLPADAGCIVDNVDTVIAIQMAVCESTPLMRRIVTVTGDAVANPGNFEVKIGTPFSEVLEAAGGWKSEPAKVIAGGPMMGMAMSTLAVPIQKTSSALLGMTVDEAAACEPSNCIRCGRCIDACPSHLMPQKMMECAEKKNLEGFQKLHGMECYECGSCTFVCPAKRHLTQAFKMMRRAVMDEARRKKAEEGKKNG